jgi:hypothetical protein
VTALASSAIPRHQTFAWSGMDVAHIGERQLGLPKG